MSQQLIEINIQEGPCLRSGQRIVLGAISAATLADHYEIPRRDSRKKQGYQRDASSTRINRLINDLSKGLVDLPTSLLFNIRDFNEQEHLRTENGQLVLVLNGTTLWVVDGQHRAEALRRLVADDADRWGKFMVPFVCMLGADEHAEMEQFYIVNSTAKSVRTDLALDLLKQRAEADPRVMRGLIETGQSWKVKAQDLTEKLDAYPPWVGRIRFPGQEKAATTISSSGMVASLRPVLRDEFFDAITTDNQIKILTTYWQALRRVLLDAFEDPSEYAVQKTIGATILNGLLVNVINVLRSRGWSLVEIDSYTKVMQEPLANLQGDNGDGEAVQGVDFWRSGSMGAAGSFTSNAGRRVLQAKLKAALPAVEVE